MKEDLLCRRVFRAALFVLLLSVVGLTNATAQSFTADNLNYTVNDDGVSVSVTGHANGTSYYGAVDIPDSVSYNENTYAVTKIAASAFQNCVGFTSVTIPSSMMFIGDEAFRGCSGLITLNYNAINCSLGTKDYTSYGSYQYHWLYGCTSLVGLNIGDGVQTIPNYFVGASEVGGTGCAGYNLTGSVIIPNSVTSIGYRAFNNCQNIGTMRIGNSVRNIGQYAFYRCYNMGSLVIGNSVENIYSYAFAECTQLASVVLPSSMTTIANYTFDGCSKLGSVTIPNTIVSIGQYAFRNCKLASLEIPNSVVSIGAYSFYQNTSLASVTMGEGMASVGASAFSGCTNLGSLTIGPNVVSIGASAFYNCGNLTTLTIPNSVVSLGNSSFYGCSRLASITMGNGVVSIGESAFYGCSALTSVTMGNAVSSIGNQAFYGCTNLPSINIPASVTSVSSDVFGNCTKLGHIAVASGNTVYDSRNNCNAIIETESNRIVAGCKNTVIPNTVTIIGDHAFYSCTVLSGTLAIPNSVTIIEPYAFYGCIGLSGALNLPNSIVRIEENAFCACTGITSVTIPSSMMFIGDEAFRGCSGLITLNYNAINCSLGTKDYTYGSYQYHWLYGCTSLVGLNIGDGVQKIPNYFVGASEVGGTGCAGYNLTGSVIIPNSVTSIGYRAFNNCQNIGTMRIGNSVRNIGQYAFYRCYNMGSLVIGNSVENIYSYAFAECTQLASVVLPSSMTTIANYTFDGCSKLGSVTIPNTIVSIGQYAFRNCKLASLEIPNSVVSIGAYSFYQNTSLASVTMGEGVASVGASSFYNCSNITSMTVRAVNPPAVMSNAFYNVPKSIPVEVPCTTLSNYQATSGWSSFTNMHENCNTTYEIVALANPTVGGSVVGSGTYAPGETCTLTATPYAGYSFVSWTENNVTVSTEENYSFNVGNDRTLVANFEYTGSYANHWIPESSNYADNMALYGVITIDGVEQATNQLELGAFCGDECRGSAIATLFSITNRYLVVMMVFGNEGDQIRFRLYDHGIGQELNYSMQSSVTFQADGYGTPVNPYVLNFLTPVEITAVVNPVGTGTVTGAGSYAPGATCALVANANSGYQFKNWTLNGTVVSTNAIYQFVVTEAAQYVANFDYVQTRALASGWNWYSTYIEQNGIDGLTMLENSLGGAGIRIQGRNGMVDFVEYQGSYSWYGSLNSITNEQMYKIRTSEACNAVVSGELASTSSHPITINSGWNWIGFPNSQSVSVATAMSDFTPEADDVIKGRNSSAAYVADYNLWYGTLNQLEPGQGYMYKSNASTAKTLTINTGRGGDEVSNVTSENNIFVPNDAEFASNMLVTAIVDMDGNELRSEDYELAAFVGDECRGSVKLMYVEPLDRYVAFLLIYGEGEEDVRFALTDGIETRWSDDQLVYASDAMIGALSQPTTIHFGVLGVNDCEQANAVVYPNPSNGIYHIKGEGLRKVEVINALGQVVMAKDEEGDFLQIDLGNNAPGTYVLRIVTNNGTVMKKLFKK